LGKFRPLIIPGSALLTTFENRVGGKEQGLGLRGWNLVLRVPGLELEVQA
jgi:hypothetical protein